MDHFFLSRLAEDTETGPQIFTKGNIGDTINFSPAPPAPEETGLLNSVLVQNGGVEDLNGIFNYTTEFGGKPYYNKDGNGNWFIVWFDNQWEIYDFSIDFGPIYFSNEDVLYPWNVTNWQAFNPIYNPVPMVTKVL
jgi:hypothetical protein